MNVKKRFRIGELADEAGTTPRTIRYYEEIGLLPAPASHEPGRHRTYGEAELHRVQELLRLRDLLGISLEQLKSVLEAEEARAALRERWHHTDDADDRRAILEQARGHVDAQLALVAARREALDRLDRELTDKRARIAARLREIEEASP